MGDGTTTTTSGVGVENSGSVENNTTTTTKENTTTTTNVEDKKETNKETKENNVNVNKNETKEVENKETKEDSTQHINEEHEKKYNELNTKYESTIKELQNLKIENSLIRLGHECGLDNKTITLFKGTIKNENVIDSRGNVKEDSIKSEIEKFLNDFPMLRQNKKSNYVKIGAEVQKEDNTKSFQDELDKAFRIK